MDFGVNKTPAEVIKEGQFGESGIEKVGKNLIH